MTRFPRMISMMMLAALPLLWTPGTEAQTATMQPATPASHPAGEKIKKITTAQAAILGVVEGITEYLPVSSTGHLILVSDYMGFTAYKDQPGPFGKMLDKEQMKAIDAFNIVIQLGAILAVLGLYRKRVGQMARGLAGREPDGLRLFLLLIVAFLPAAIIGKLFHDKIELYLFGPIPVIYAMAAGGGLMIVVEYFFWRKDNVGKRTSRVDRVFFWQALVIGLAQCLAMWPGTSRSMITMLAALVVGLDMVAAAEFSFLLALPTLGAATLYSAFKDWGALMDSTGFVGMLVGLGASCVVAAVAVKMFVRWLTRHGLMPFGIYRLIAAAVLFFVFCK